MSQAEFYRGVEAAQQALRSAKPDAHARCTAVAAALDAMVATTETATLRACRDGCAHCCHHPVGVTLPEAMTLVAAVRALPHPRRTELELRIADAAATTRDVPWAQLAHQPCPLLDPQQRCSLYIARPLPCRAWTSTDADRCAAPGPLGIPFDRAAFLAGLGAASALRSDGPEPRELRSALASLLAAPDAEPAHAFGQARAAGG